jgi:asparagine synthase (glutamine-hydrolysing)
MTASLTHRGPDANGIHIEEGVGLGHRRLSIIDLSPAGNQPMSNEDGTIWIVYNGEIYNFHELRTELESKGHRFKSHTDTEVILHLYEEKEARCVERLRGMFAFAIWDAGRQRLFLARDRLGQKPLFYALTGNAVTFASELKAILENNDVSRSLNPLALHQYLTYGYIAAPDTIFTNIKKLPPGHMLVKEKGRLAIEPYWQFHLRHKRDLSEEDYCHRLRGLLTEATKIRLVSDVPLGAFLSGGIDSSIVVALMAQLSNRAVKTFSIGFEEQSFNELGYARTVAQRFATEHHEFVVKPKALDILPKLVDHFGEPFADSSAIPTYYLSQMTRQHVTVALNGDAGDEGFAGYDRYLAEPMRKYVAWLWLLRPVLALLPESTRKKDTIKRLKLFTKMLGLPREQAYALLMSIIDNGLKEKLYTDDFKNRVGAHDAYDYLVNTYRLTSTADFLDATLYVDTTTYLPNDLLVKVDITAMANSLEARSPFIDHHVLEFAAQIPSHLKLKGFTGKHILKKAFADVLPPRILKRKKAGFGMPVGSWFRNELKRYAYEVLLDDSCIRRGYFKKDVLKTLLDEHTTGKRDHGHRIWALIMLELWHRRFLK